MKALLLEQYKKFALVDMPVPEPGPDEVLVAVKACGICGSDVHGMDGSTGRRQPPIVMGHEASGEIARVGSSVRDWKPGDRVALDSTVYCGRCHYCRRGEINLCDNRRVLGVSCGDYRQHGAFAEFVVAPERILHRVPDALSFEHGALVEPFAIALHAVARAPLSLNDSAVVVGAGMIGLALVQALRAAGCGRIISVDVAPDRLALAAKMGATDTVNSAGEKPAETIVRLTDGGGADLAFEAVGVSETVACAVAGLRKGGSLVLVGNVTPSINFPLQAAVTREISLFGSCASRGEYPAVLGMMARGVLRPDTLISAVAPLAEGPRWFDRLYNKEPGLLKVLLTP